MLTGQETIREVFDRSPKAKTVLYKYGITLEAAEHFHYKNLAHAAILLKIPLQRILNELAAVTGETVKKVKVKGIKLEQSVPRQGLRRGGLPNIKKIIAVHSGKGGVGKTFVAVNLAAYLAFTGLKVGLLDADIDCPNVFHMLQADEKLVANKAKMIVPAQKFGMKIVSMAPLLKNENEALLWRGPIVSRVLEQFLYDVDWGNLDILVVDLPPGTSDLPITLYNLLPRSEVLLVSTPHQLGLLDVRKAAALASKMKIKILGLVENMAGEVFGGGTDEVSKKLGIPFLGSIQLHTAYAQIHEQGNPHVFFSKELQRFYKNLWNKISR